MKKGIIVLLAVFAVAAWAGDLNPNAGRAQGTGPTYYPSAVGLKKLWTGGAVCPDMGLVSANDGACWNYANPEHKPYLYMIYKFHKPSGYSSGTLRWRIWGNSGQAITIFRWKPATSTWVSIDSYGGGTNIPLQTFTPIPASWFNAYGDLIIMAVVNSTPNHWNIICDICDIQY